MPALRWSKWALHSKKCSEYHLDVFFFSQAIFAATCATIVSGAMAERTKFFSYVAFCLFATMFIYPLIGHWIWGGEISVHGVSGVFGTLAVGALSMEGGLFYGGGL